MKLGKIMGFNRGSTVTRRGLALACGLMLALQASMSLAQSLEDVTEELCILGDCENGRSTVELTTPFGKGKYVGIFRDGEFDGQGRLEIPISFLATEIYVGNWTRGIRSGRGTHWDGEGNLYIGQWSDNKREGQGSYFVKLPRWEENKHSEYWLSQNSENYSGEFVNDHYHGQGIYRWPEGQSYVGGFFASNKHGPGTYYYVTGSQRKQLWNYGDFVR